jgi:hypothetical protein
MIPTTKIVHISPTCCGPTTPRKPARSLTGYRPILKSPSWHRLSLRAPTASTPINSPHSLVPSQHIPAVLREGEGEAFQTCGILLPPRRLRPPRVSELPAQLRALYVRVTPADLSQGQVADNRVLHNLAPVRDLYRVNELGATRILRLQLLQPWAPVTVSELVCRVGAAEGAAPRLAAKALMDRRVAI